jgi:large subunit ribosomal protein L14
MVSIGTKLTVADNTGGITAKCFKILKNSFRNSSLVGDILVIAIQSSKVKKKVTRGQVHRSVLIRQRRKTYRKNGVYLKFDNNSVVLIKPNNDPLGSRVKGSVMQELRYKGFVKVMLLASNIV